MKYEEYIHSEHWQNLRQWALSNSPQCEACSRVDKQLHVHHLQYRNLIDCSLEDVMVLCQPCHSRWHQTNSSHVVATKGQVRRAVLGDLIKPQISTHNVRLYGMKSALKKLGPMRDRLKVFMTAIPSKRQLDELLEELPKFREWLPDEPIYR